MNKTTFKIAKMDCLSEEQMIRMTLSELSHIKSLDFDIAQGQLTVFHINHYESILQCLDSLQFDTQLIESVAAESITFTDKQQKESKLLWQVLFINLFLFVVEIFTGFTYQSLGLVADSLDMLADGIVYGLALFAVGGTLQRKKNIAKSAGYFQLVLAILGFVEVIRRFLAYQEVPNFQIMMIVSVFALIGNAICLYLLQKNKSKEAHIQASMIFTSNDVIINLGVMVAGGLVYWTNTKFPDLLIGTIVFVFVVQQSFKILKLSK